MENPTSTPIETPAFPVGIIGGGFGALLSFGALRFRGVPAQDIRVFSATASPEETWLGFVHMIGQSFMRSESDGHFLPTTSPGLATVEALNSWSLKPILLSWFDRYHPTVAFMVNHLRQVASQLSFWHSLVRCQVSRLERVGDHFILFDEKGRPVARVNHVIMAIGHGPRRIPAVMSWFERTYPTDGRVIHSFIHKGYTPPETVLVLGDGLTAATEWISILEAGAHVLAISQTGFRFGQALNTPRRYFSKRGFAAYQQKEGTQRVEELAAATRGTIPLYPAWRRRIRTARNTGSLQLIQGTLMSIDPVRPNGRLEGIVQLPDRSYFTVTVDRVVCATGFAPATTHPLWQQLINDYQLPTYEGFLMVADDFSVPSLSQPTSSLFAVGAAAAWVLPCADSLVGMKVAARAIADRIVGEETWTLQELFTKTRQWFLLLSGKTI